MSKLDRARQYLITYSERLWIDLRKHKSAVELRHTIAHELIHINTRIPHGKRFEELTRALISSAFVECKVSNKHNN